VAQQRHKHRAIEGCARIYFGMSVSAVYLEATARSVGDPDDLASEVAEDAQVRRVVGGMPMTDVRSGG
jgi:hypothetical protein